MERSVRSRLVLLALSVALPAVLALCLAALEGWRAARARTDGVLLARAEALAAGVARELTVARTALEVLAASPRLTSGDLEAFRRELDGAPRPPGARIVLTGVDGRMLVNSLFPWGTPLPLRGDLDVVRRVFETGQAQVSNLYVSPMTRELLVAVDVPVRGPDGRVLYDLNMGFRAASLGPVLVEQRLPHTWRAALLDGRGVIVARNQRETDFVGRPAAARSREAVAAGQTPSTP